MAKHWYPAEKFAAARGLLMAPHPQGEAGSFSRAFWECDLGLRAVSIDDIDDGVRSWLQTIKQTINTAGIDDPDNRSKWFIKAEQLSVEEKNSFSLAVAELAGWFREKSTAYLN